MPLLAAPVLAAPVLAVAVPVLAVPVPAQAVPLSAVHLPSIAAARPFAHTLDAQVRLIAAAIAAASSILALPCLLPGVPFVAALDYQLPGAQRYPHIHLLIHPSQV